MAYRGPAYGLSAQIASKDPLLLAIPQVLSPHILREADDPSENSFLACRGFGLKCELAKTIREARAAGSHRNGMPELESQILDWIEEVLEQRLPQGPYEEVLRDGVVLCKLMNALNPGCIPKINTTGGQFKKMENIVLFQNAAKEWGVPDLDHWDERATCTRNTRDPCLGPKPAEENKRNFSEQQLRAGEGIINLQYGTNKGANASGINFGNTRHM
ncbi:hypothetical protein MRX96_011548 [Rhipicephalus microplus]